MSHIELSPHELCMEQCRDIHTLKIKGGIDLGYFEFIGYGTVIDSLAAIKKVVFEDKKLTLARVKEAMEHNFDGYEIERQLLKNAPAYGNDDSYADEIGRILDRELLEYTKKYSEELGVNLDLRYVPFTSNVPFGKVVSATPNGRLAYLPLSDGSSASQGADKNGPTAVLLSNYATKNYDFRNRAARLLNIKLSPQCVKGDEGTQKLVQFIKTWCDLKLWHLQFNVINRETLIEAQKGKAHFTATAGEASLFREESLLCRENLRSRYSGLHGREKSARRRRPAAAAIRKR